MKMNIRLVFILLIISASLPLYPETSDKTDDPIGNSYIVNHLEMESTSDPDSGNNDSLSGEIIFDDIKDARIPPRRNMISKIVMTNRFIEDCLASL